MLLWLVFFALFILCSGISIIFLVYIFIVWYGSFVSQPTSFNSNAPAHKMAKKGLSRMELDMLPGVLEGGGGVAKGVECAVCLDNIEEGQPARVIPGCGHVFHRGCADAWLAANAVCPMCRTRLLPPAVVQQAVLLPPPPPEVGVV